MLALRPLEGSLRHIVAVLTAVALTGGALPGETMRGVAAAYDVLDRVVANVDQNAVLESELQRFLRLRAFQNNEAVPATAEARREALRQLVDQTLLLREMAQVGFPTPDGKQVDAALADLRRERGAQWGATLTRYGVTEGQVRSFVGRQLAALQFIATRFRPGVVLSEGEIEEYYRDEYVPARRQTSRQPVPALAEARAEIEQKLTDRRTDQALERWLGDMRIQSRIRFRDEPQPEPVKPGEVKPSEVKP